MAQLVSSLDFQHALTTYCSAGARTLASHIARRHLLPLLHTRSTGPCPWPACAFDGDARSLAQHFVDVHYIFLVPDLDRRVAQDLSNLAIINEAKDPKRKARSSEAASSGNAIAGPSTTLVTQRTEAAWSEATARRPLRLVLCVRHELVRRSQQADPATQA